MMKTMGKWLLLLIFMVSLIGCFGGGGGDSSEDEPIPAPENPILGTWKVTVDPKHEKVTIEPVTSGAAGYPVATVKDEAHSLPIGTPVNLAHTRVVSKSDEVYSGPNKSGTKYIRDTDYSITLGNGTDPGTITNLGAGIGDNQTVYVNYKYFKCTDCVGMDLSFLVTDANVSYANSVTTVDITVQNNAGNYIFEKIRSITGLTSGDGAAANPKLANSDYPLANGDTPVGTPQDVDGWNAGICYTTWGTWRTFTVGQPPAVQGCSLRTHPMQPATDLYGPQWLDPVCGRITNTWQLSGTNQQYQFYMQLTGNAYPWTPDPFGPPADPRWTQRGAGPSGGSMWNSTWVAAMAYLAGTNRDYDGVYCTSDNLGINAYRAGYLGKVKLDTGETDRCGILITDPHLAPDTYFALNIGIEYADWVEQWGKDFWDAYIAAGPSRNNEGQYGNGAVYMNSFGFALLYDPAVLEVPDIGMDNWTPVGNTAYTGGFQPYYTPTANNNQTVIPRASGKWSVSSAIGSEYIYTTQSVRAGVAAGAFNFFRPPTSAPYRTFLYVTQQTSEYCGAAGYQGIVNLPQFGGQWGLAHYEGIGNQCQMITEGPDAEVDFWAALVVMHVLPTANPGDWSYLRFDQTSNNSLEWYWNNRTPDRYIGAANTEDDIKTMCWRTGSTAPTTCASYDNLDIVVFNGKEAGNPYLPPGIRQTPPTWQGACPATETHPAGTGFVCGGRQYILPVVCVQ